MFDATRSVWWEGGIKPLCLQRLYPANGGFLGAAVRPVNAVGWDSLIAPTDRSRVVSFFGDLPRRPLPASLDYRLMRRERSLWVRHTVFQLRSSGRSQVVRSIVSDLAETKKLEEENLLISEREQKRIGQDLHDDLCQVLAGLSCLTRVLENRMAAKVPEEIDKLREINREMVDAMERTRALTHGLFPAKIHSGDARTALLELAKQVQVRFGVKVATDFRGRLAIYDKEKVLQLYRIAQEAISNAIKHGQAHQIFLSLHRRGSSMLLTIRDDGSGFPAFRSPQEGIGLHIMRHRASLLGGELQVGNAPQGGALVTLRYHPLSSS